MCTRKLTLDQVSMHWLDELKAVIVSEEEHNENENKNGIKWGSKMGKILDIIQSILNDENADPESKKILVYSQWEDSLCILAHVLQYVIVLSFHVQRVTNQVFNYEQNKELWEYFPIPEWSEYLSFPYASSARQ